MSFRDPDVQIHATGWLAIFIVAYIVLTIITNFLSLIAKLTGVI